MSKALEFIGEIKGGKFSRSRQIALLFGKLPDGKRIKLTVSEVKRRRSLDQNAFLHGPFVEAMQEMFNEQGLLYSRETVKAILKRLHGPKASIILPGGTVQEVDKSTAEYTTTECEETMERARAWAAEWFGWPLPYPNETASPTLEPHSCAGIGGAV